MFKISSFIPLGTWVEFVPKWTKNMKIKKIRGVNLKGNRSMYSDMGNLNLQEVSAFFLEIDVFFAGNFKNQN